MERRLVPGLVLIIVGGILLLARLQVLGGDLTVLIIGALLLAVYVASGTGGLLFPGAILTGLGAGIALRERLGPESATVPLGLGVGFLLIYAFGEARGPRTGWWPLIPGGILVVVGLMQAARAYGPLKMAASWWPVLLIAIGVWLILRPKSTV
jgi:hypothetical protein